jgi:hypothetical protein
MAALWTEGFDHYGTQADLTTRWANSGGSGITFPAGYLGGKCVSLAAGSGTQPTFSRRFYPSTDITEFIVGFWWMTNNITLDHDRTIFYVEDSSAFVCSLHYTTDGRLAVCRGSGGTTIVAQSASGLLASNTWYHIEARYKPHNSTGSGVVKLNGTTVVSASGNLSSSGSNIARALRFYGGNVSDGGVRSYDHVVVMDISGSAFNDFIGPSTIKTLFPSGAGDLTQWAPNTGTNYQAVDEIGEDGDTTYVSASTAGNKDLYNFDDLASTDSPKLVTVLTLTRKDDGTARTMAPTIRSGATDLDGSTYTQTTSYDYAEMITETDPNTSAAWTKAAVDALQAGVKVVS